MKKTLLIAGVLLMCTAFEVYAQFEGKRFISGIADLNFSNNNPDLRRASNAYGYDLNLGIGKFRTNTKASGWSVSHTFGGSRVFRLNSGGIEALYTNYKVGAGVGHFWQYYKHLNDKFGIFGGPNVNSSFSYARNFEDVSNDLQERKTSTIMLHAGLDAGLYYKFSERWWVLASIGFSNPLFVEYALATVQSQTTKITVTNHTLNYRFAPTLTFPSVGLGFRRFLK